MAIIKPQYVDHIPRAVKGTVQEIIEQKCQRDNAESIMRILDLVQVADRPIDRLSGGELQAKRDGALDTPLCERVRAASRRRKIRGDLSKTHPEINIS